MINEDNLVGTTYLNIIYCVSTQTIQILYKVQMLTVYANQTYSKTFLMIHAR